MYVCKKKHLPLSTFVIDIPRLGVRITRKHSDVERNFMKLRLSPSLSLLRIAAAFLSISDDLHDDVDEFCESRLDFFMQMQLLNIVHALLNYFTSLIIFRILSFPSSNHYIYSSNATKLLCSLLCYYYHSLHLFLLKFLDCHWLE